MQLVRNIAIAVRDLLQTLDYAPTAIKEMVSGIHFGINDFVFEIFISRNNVIIIFRRWLLH